MNKNFTSSGRTDCPAADVSWQNAPTMSLAAQRVRALQPTIFCPSGQVEQCVRQATLSRITA